MTIWPWAETNQGFLSVLALAAALAFALLEFARAERAEGKRQRDYARLVTDLLDGSVSRLDELAARKPPTGALFSETVGPWNSHVGKSYQVVEAIIPAVPPDARLALLMLDVREFFHMNDIQIGTQSSALESLVTHRRQALFLLRDSIAELGR